MLHKNSKDNGNSPSIDVYVRLPEWGCLCMAEDVQLTKVNWIQYVRGLHPSTNLKAMW